MCRLSAFPSTAAAQSIIQAVGIFGDSHALGLGRMQGAWWYQLFVEGAVRQGTQTCIQKRNSRALLALPVWKPRVGQEYRITVENSEEQQERQEQPFKLERIN